MKKVICWIVRVSLLVGLIIGIVGVSFFVKRFFADLTSPAEVTLETEGIYSDSSLKVIGDVLNSLISSKGIKNFSPTLYCEQISKVVDIVQEVRWKMDSSKKGILTVVGVKPSFILGVDRVIAENRKIYPKKSFERYNFSKLRKITFSLNYCCQEISTNLYQFLQKIPPKLWDRYTITCEKPTLIRLQDLVRNWEIIVDEKNIFDLDKMKQLELVAEDIDLKKSLTRRRKREARLVFDLRFDKRILVKSRDK